MMIALIGAPIGIELAREHVRELRSAAEKYRREHPRPPQLRGDDSAMSTKRIVTRIRRALSTADVTLQPDEVRSR